MHCNNSLNNNQLKAMFPATDEEMQQIVQPMECLIERIKHKCKRCGRFFSNEAALKQHHWEPQIKKENCPCCSKTINHANSLEKHWRSWEKAHTDPSKWQLCQTNLDGPTSLENGPSHLRNWLLRKCKWVVHLLNMINIGKAPESVESALKYMALTFKKAFNSNNTRDILQRLKEVNEGQTRANVEAFKWYVLLNMNFWKSTSPGVKTDPAVTFRSEVFKFNNNHKLDYQFHVGYNKIVL